MTISDACYARLEKITGPKNVTREKEELVCYSYDATGDIHLPDAVIFPGTENEISGR